MKHRLVREIFGVILLALAVFIALSLVSYEPKDPSLNHMCQSGVRQARNLTGPSGAYAADLALSYGGGIAFLLPLLIALVAWGQFKLQGWKRSVVQLAGVLLFVFSTCGMLSLITYDTSLRIFENFSYGGVIGELVISSFLIDYLNVTGTWIVLCTLSLISILVFTNLSLYDFMFSMKDMAAQGITSLRKWRADRRESPRPWRKNQAEKSRRANSRLSGEGKAEEGKKPSLDKDRKLKQALAVYKGPLPPLTLLDQAEKLNISESKQSIQESSRKLESTLSDFGVQGQVIQVYPGPVVTRFEFEPAPGIKISKISNLSDDLALAMKAVSVRIVAPVPGKSVVGLEIPNQYREKVYLREILESEPFKTARSRLALALGKDIAGLPYATDLARMPHLLVAGATGSGSENVVFWTSCSGRNCQNDNEFALSRLFSAESPFFWVKWLDG
ncbi:MAG: DNA translocase FtsK 4TM domain-containing protein, partial [bacterium]